jgi:hypothetical protein
VVPVASFTRAKTHSPGMMKESEDGTSHVNDPVFLILSEDIVNQLFFEAKEELILAKVTLGPSGESLMINSEMVGCMLGDQLNV